MAPVFLRGACGGLPRLRLLMIRSLPFSHTSRSSGGGDCAEDEKPSAPSFWDKCKGDDGSAAPPLPGMRAVAVSGAGAFAGVGALSLAHFGLFSGSDMTMILGSMGATAALVYGAPAAPFSQPRNVLGGHLISVLIGVGCRMILPLPLAVPAAASLSIMAMQGTGTLHPPAGGTTLIAVLGGPAVVSMGFGLAVPTLLGASTLVAVGCLNNLDGTRQYPQYWW